MRKFFFAALMVFATLTAVVPAQDSGNASIPNMGRAPRGVDGIGRLDLRVVDESGQPVKGVFAELESRRVNGMFCEAWNTSGTDGVAVLPPLHMGRLTLKLKADGFQKQEIKVDPNALDEPVRVTMLRKK